MNKPEKPRSALREFFVPGPSAYDHRRSYRIFFLSVLFGIAIAVGFGYVLYYLNNAHRL